MKATTFFLPLCFLLQSCAWFQDPPPKEGEEREKPSAVIPPPNLGGSLNSPTDTTQHSDPAEPRAFR